MSSTASDEYRFTLFRIFVTHAPRGVAEIQKLLPEYRDKNEFLP